MTKFFMLLIVAMPLIVIAVGINSFSGLLGF